VNVRLAAWNVLCDLLFSRVNAHDELHANVGDATFDAELVGLANSTLTTASLWPALRRNSLDDRLSKDIGEYLSAYYALSTERNQGIRLQLTECVRALNQSGVTPLPLKGAAYLLSSLYPDPAERFMHDVDLLVPAAQAKDAASALADIGFRPAHMNFDHSKHHHLPPLVRTLDDVAIELHTAPVSSVAQAGLSTEEIWVGATTMHHDHCCWHVATATDLAMLSFLHSEVVDRHLARCVLNLRGYLDLQQLVQRAGRNIDWRRNLARAGKCVGSSTFNCYLYVFMQLTGQILPQFSRTRWRDRAYLAVCRSAVRWPAIQHWAHDVQELASRRLKRRYSIGDGSIILNAYRIRALGGMIRNRLFN
jgi:hypothetical protein